MLVDRRRRRDDVGEHERTDEDVRAAPEDQDRAAGPVGHQQQPPPEAGSAGLDERERQEPRDHLEQHGDRAKRERSR